MTNRNRDLLLLMKATSFSEDAFEKHVESLHKVLLRVECVDTFCAVHELATRITITQKRPRIIRAITAPELKPFHFLINKN